MLYAFDASPAGILCSATVDRSRYSRVVSRAIPGEETNGERASSHISNTRCIVTTINRLRKQKISGTSGVHTDLQRSMQSNGRSGVISSAMAALTNERRHRFSGDGWAVLRKTRLPRERSITTSQHAAHLNDATRWKTTFAVFPQTNG